MKKYKTKAGDSFVRPGHFQPSVPAGRDDEFCRVARGHVPAQQQARPFVDRLVKVVLYKEWLVINHWKLTTTGSKP